MYSKVLFGLLLGILILGAREYASAQEITKDCDRIKVVYQVTDESNSEKNGEIRLVLEGGKPPYTIHWFAYDFSKKGEHIKNLESGFYTAVIFDAERCIMQIDNIQVKNTNEKQN